MLFHCPLHLDDAFNKKQRHLKAQAFAIKMRPRKETLEVNFVSTSSLRSLAKFLYTGLNNAKVADRMYELKYIFTYLNNSPKGSVFRHLDFFQE